MLQRAVTEARGDRHTVDVVETNGPEMETLHREQILQAVKSPHLADLIPPALRPHGEWVGTRLNVFALAYNTKLVKKEELPKSWADLANPRWKGRLGIEAGRPDWLAGRARAARRGARHARSSATSSRRTASRCASGHTLLTQLVVSGEVPLALTVYNYKAEQLKNQGAPIDWFAIGTAIGARPTASAWRDARRTRTRRCCSTISRSARRAQQILAKRDFVPTNRKVDTPLNKIADEVRRPARR